MRGIVRCDASGFVRNRDDMMSDVRQGRVAKEFADITPGFGTKHPQDVVQLGSLDDPKPIPEGNRIDKQNLSKSDLNISDAEILASIREGRQPREGY